MKYIYRKHPSKLSTILVGFSAGSRVEFNSKYHKGMAHLMEHCRFLGAGNKDKKQLARELAAVGGNWNAFTSKDIVCYYVSIPEENLEAGCSILSDIVLRPIFPASEVDREKEVVCQEVRMYDDDIDSLVSDRLYNKAFDNALQSPVVGFEDTVRQVSRQDLLNFNNEFYQPNKMAVVLCAPNNHEDLITKYFTSNNGAFDRLAKSQEVKYAPSFESEVVKESLIQDTISLSFGSPEIYKLNDPQLEAKVDMFNHIFGRDDVSRLFLKVREDLGLVYGIRSGMSGHLDGALFNIRTLTEPANRDKVLNAINEEIARMTNELPTQEELNTAKNRFKSSIYSMMDSSFGATHHVLDELFFNSQPMNVVLENVDRVSVEDVREVARTIFSGNRYLVIGKGK